MRKVKIEYYSSSEEKTFKLGKIIGSLLKSGQILLLDGDLGAGKTLMVKGICRGLGVEESVTSPTYTLINEYMGRYKVYHMDLYRLKTAEDVFQLGIEEYLADDGIVLVEWPELTFEFLVPDFIYVIITKENDKERNIVIKGTGKNSLRLINNLVNTEELDINVSTGD